MLTDSFLGRPMGVFSGTTKKTLPFSVMSWKNQRKSAKISGGECWTSTNVVHT